MEAGSAAGNNLLRSLKDGDPSLFTVGCNDSRFFLKKSTADRNYVLPFSTHKFVPALRRIIKQERIDLVIPTSDSYVFKLSQVRGKLEGRVFLPPPSVIARCGDKYGLSQFLDKRGVPVPITYAITEVDKVDALFRRFKNADRLWCRMRSGAGSRGAIPVTTPEQARSWILYWERLRAVKPGSFTLSEYLPGRDYCVQCLWDNGTLVLAKMARRITYLENGGPSGVSSMPALAETAYDAEVIAICAKAIRAVHRKASGIFFVDLKENEKQQACITEINVGRFATMTNIHDLVGKHNMATLFVRLAIGEKIKLGTSSDFAKDHFLVRSVDTEPAIVRGSELRVGLHETGLGE